PPPRLLYSLHFRFVKGSEVEDHIVHHEGLLLSGETLDVLGVQHVYKELRSRLRLDLDPEVFQGLAKKVGDLNSLECVGDRNHCAVLLVVEGHSLPTDITIAHPQSVSRDLGKYYFSQPRTCVS